MSITVLYAQGICGVNEQDERSPQSRLSSLQLQHLGTIANQPGAPMPTGSMEPY